MSFVKEIVVVYCSAIRLMVCLAASSYSGHYSILSAQLDVALALTSLVACKVP